MNSVLKKLLILLAIVLVVGMVLYPLLDNGAGVSSKYDEEYYGSIGCEQCHERFYKLWAPSHHGLAMQTITKEFVNKEFAKFTDVEILVDSTWFSVVNEQDSLVFIGRDINGSTKYTATYALGGKNIYYFLTPMENGRLQVLPLAYDLNKKEWYNNPESAIRHFPDAEQHDEALPWTHMSFTFNTSCWGCHVSQLENNYNVESNSYHTTWRENGINCETCHGPSTEHVKACVDAGEGNVPDDLKIIVTSNFTHEQNNASCAPCHAKMSPITSSFMPGDKYFDNYTLVTLEHDDFYPDGRDLGENYTMTTWHLSGCTKSGEIDCLHCHTSSGRYRFATENPNNACMPCHDKQVNNVEKHSHHLANKEGGKCISCHMPKTEFARMKRSDHSMRPPMPRASMEFGSPNACVICHENKSNEWAQKYLEEWDKDDHQDAVIEQGKLLREARNGDWKNLDKMLKYLDEGIFDEVYSNSFLRLLIACPSEKKISSFIKALDHSSPLVRSSACAGLAQVNDTMVFNKLLLRCSDEYRLVRIDAAVAISTLDPQLSTGKDISAYEKALKEFVFSRTSRPDDWGAQASLGNFFHNQNNLSKAIEHYNISSAINPDNIGALVNSALAYSVLNDNATAKAKLEMALLVDSANETINLNYGLLMGEIGENKKAIKSFKRVLDRQPTSAVAAFNLSVLVSKQSIPEAIKYAKIASDNDEGNPKYDYTYAYFLNSDKQYSKASNILVNSIKDYPTATDAYFLLASIYKQQGYMAKAKKVLSDAIANDGLPDQVRMQMQQQLVNIK